MGNDPLRKDHIFNVAAEISDPELRAAYLDEACGGDRTLREQVERLLRHDQDAGSFLESPASAFANTVTPAPLTEKPGTVIGPYKLLQQIGEGGFGVVYMAEQTEPVRRKVALKIIKPGMDTKEVIARFEAERQALALMDHPNIARVLDAGTTEPPLSSEGRGVGGEGGGRPYFVMELVKGVPVIEYCDKNHLSTRDRLKLFVDICHAIQHAHQKGVIHRDLKPSNIMVTLHDGKPVPKVIDFGVSKALSQQLTEKTLFTAYGQMVGTPAYMSPEQAEMSGLDIDTRSDVYSLGVLLYELLTGSTPFDARRLREAGFAEMQRIIREEEPVKPSTRLTTLGEESTVVSSNRGTDPKKLGQLVRGELDWIVMKALDKERNRRYETANGFAADIERFLADEPVEACPPSAAYRFSKFARRNKAPMAVAATAFAVLLVVAIGSLIAAGRFRNLAGRLETALTAETDAKNAARDAQQEAEDARDREQELRIEAQEQTEIAEAALEREAEERERAQANFALARAAVDQFLNEVTDTDLLTVPGLQPLRQKLLSSALGFYEDFAEDEENASELLVELASAHYRIGLIRREMDQTDEARASNTLSIQLFEQLVAGGNDSVEVRLGLAKACYRSERYDETVTLCRQILESHPQDAETRGLLGDTYNSLAIDEKNDDDIAAALAYHQQALELREGLVEEFPDNAGHLAELGSTVHNIGVLLARQKRYREAFAMYERAVAYDAEAYQKSSEKILWGRWLCISLETVANYQKYFGEQDAALTAYQRLVTIRRKLAFDNPAVPSLKGELYKAWITLGNYQQELELHPEAQRSFDAARDVLENIPRDTPEELFGLATVYAALAAPVEGSVNVPDEDAAELPDEQAEDHQHYADLAVETLRQAVDAGYRDLEAVRSNPQLEALRARGDLPELALLEVRLENEQLEADELLQADEGAADEPRTGDRNRAAQLLRDLAASNALEERDQQTRAATLHAMGVIQTGLKQYEPAEQSLNEALRLRQELLTESSDNLERRLDVLATRSAVGSLFWKTRREPEAHQLWQECLAGFQRLAEDIPQDQEALLKRVVHEEHKIGDSYANIGIYDVTTDIVRRHLELGRADTEQHAISLALAGDFDAHRRFTRIFAPQRRMNPEEVLWVASSSPDAGLSPEELQRLAEEVVDKEEVRRFWRYFVAATGEYRAGRYQQALDRLDESAIGDAAKYRDYWRALILEKLGRHSEAVTWLGKAETAFRQFVLHKSTRGVARGIGFFFAHTQVIRREAWKEIEGETADDPWRHLLQANGYRLIGETELADRELASAIATASDSASIVSVLDSLGDLQSAFAVAEQSLREQLEVRRQILAESDDPAQAEVDVLRARYAIGNLYWVSGRLPEAHEHWQQLLPDLPAVSDANRDNWPIRDAALQIERDICNAYGRIGLWELAARHSLYDIQFGRSRTGPLDSWMSSVLAAIGNTDDYHEWQRSFYEQYLRRESAGNAFGNYLSAKMVLQASLLPESSIPPEQLVQVAREAFDADPDEYRFRVTLALASLRCGQYEEAIDLVQGFESLQGNDPSLEDPYGLASAYVRAMAHRELQQFDEAQRILAAAEQKYREIYQATLESLELEFAPPISDKWYWLAFAQQLRREAREKLDGAPSPVDPWQHMVQARGYRLIGEPERSDQELAAAIAAGVRDSTALEALLDSVAMMESGFDVAEESLRNVLEARLKVLDESDDSARAEVDVLRARYAIGRLYWISGRLPEAHQLWQQLLPDVPAVSEALRDNNSLWQEALEVERNICNAYGRIGLWELAAQHSRYDIQLSRRRTRSPDAWMSSALAALGRMDEYREYHEFYYTHYQNWGAENWDPWMVARLTWHAGLLAEPTIPSDQLVAVTREALDTTPGWDWFPLTLALASLRNDQFDKVLALLEDTRWAQADNPKTGHFRTLFAPYIRAMAHHELQQFDDAQRMLDAAEQKYREICQATAENSELRIAAPISDEWWWLAFAQQLRREAREKLDGTPPPDDPWQHLIQARGYRLIGEHEQADQELAAAIPAAGDDSEAWSAITRLADAEETWQAALQRSDDLRLFLVRGRWYAQRGDQEKADADYAHAAALTPNELNRFLEAGWWIAGPYPQSLHVVCPPELDPDPSRPVHVIDPQTGLSDEPVAWRNMPAGEAGRIDLSTLVAGGQDASSYALGHVYSPDERTATLRTDQDLPLRVWVNGVRCPTIGPVFSNDGLERNYYLTPLTLRAGRNTVLLKLGVSAATAPVWIRLNDHPVDRAFDLARAGLLDEAGDLLASEFAESPGEDWHWLAYKCEVLITHHPETRRAVAFDMLAHNHPARMRFSAMTPDCPLDPDVLSAFADERNTPERLAAQPRLRTTLGLIYLRAGRYEDALSILNDKGSTPIQALAHHHLGHQEEARQLLNDSVAELESVVSAAQSGRYARYVNFPRYFAWTREAHALIAGNTERVDQLYSLLQQARREWWETRDPATEAFDDLVAIAPDDPQAWLARGQRLAELGRLDEAGADFNTAVELDPDNPYLLITRMSLRADRGDLDAAVQDCIDVDRLSGGHWLVLHTLALEVAASPELFERVVATRPDDFRPWAARMALLAWEGDLDAAQMVARRMEEHVPDTQRARVAIALLRNDTAEWERIRDLRPQTWDPGETARLLMLAPTAEPLTGELLSAAEWGELNVPNNSKVYWQSCMGVALFRAGRLEEARRKLEPLITTDLHAGRIWPVLAMIDYQLGDVEQARSWLNRSTVWMESHGPDARFATRRPPKGWNYWLEAAVFHQEATQLINAGQKEPADDLAASAESDNEQEEGAENAEPE